MSHFFGLNSEYRELQLEEFYVLMKLANFSYEALRTLPVSYRAWFIKRIMRDYTVKTKDQYGLDDDTPLSIGR